MNKIKKIKITRLEAGIKKSQDRSSPGPKKKFLKAMLEHAECF